MALHSHILLYNLANIMFVILGCMHLIYIDINMSLPRGVEYCDFRMLILRLLACLVLFFNKYFVIINGGEFIRALIA